VENCIIGDQMSNDARSFFYEFQAFKEHVECCVSCQRKLISEEIYREIMAHAHFEMTENPKLPNIPDINNPDGLLTVRLTGWVDKDLKCVVLGFEDRGEFRIPMEKVADSLLRLVEIEKYLGEVIDEDLVWFNGKIVDLTFIGGLRIRKDLIDLEKAGSKYEYDFELKQIKSQNALLMG
jgi:hypothetical protein